VKNAVKERMYVYSVDKEKIRVEKIMKLSKELAFAVSFALDGGLDKCPEDHLEMIWMRTIGNT